MDGDMDIYIYMEIHGTIFVFCILLYTYVRASSIMEIVECGQIKTLVIAQHLMGAVRSTNSSVDTDFT